MATINHHHRDANLPTTAADAHTLTDEQRAMIAQLKAKAENERAERAAQLKREQANAAQAVAAAREASIRAELRAGFIGTDEDFERVFPGMRDTWLLKQGATIQRAQARRMREVF